MIGNSVALNRSSASSASKKRSLLSARVPSSRNIAAASKLTAFSNRYGTTPGYACVNAAMANVLPPEVRARGFGISTMSIHLFGDALSPFLIGLASDRVGLRLPVLVTGLLIVIAGLVLLVGQSALRRDMDQRGVKPLHASAVAVGFEAAP